METSRTAKNRKLIYGIEIEREFTNGFIIGLGVGFIALFIVLWVSAFFASIISGMSYGRLLSVFIYPMVFMLAAGISLVVAGFVRERVS
jgi:polyferredoxin